MRTAGCSVTDGGVRAALIEFTVNFGDGGQLGCGYSTERWQNKKVRNLFLFFMSYICALRTVTVIAVFIWGVK